jgi:hypothetical protein
MALHSLALLPQYLGQLGQKPMAALFGGRERDAEFACQVPMANAATAAAPEVALVCAQSSQHALETFRGFGLLDALSRIISASPGPGSPQQLGSGRAPVQAAFVAPLVPDVVLEVSRDDPTEKLAEGVTIRLAQLRRVVTIDGFLDSEHGVLPSILKVFGRHANLPGPPGDYPVELSIIASQQLLFGWLIAALLGQHNQLFITYLGHVQVVGLGGDFHCRVLLKDCGVVKKVDRFQSPFASGGGLYK